MEGTVKDALAAHSMSSSHTLLHVSSLRITDVPVYTLPSLTKWLIANFTFPMSAPSGNATYRSAALLMSFSLRSKERV